MKSNQFEMSILVDGKPIGEYEHQGSTFVEGRAGSEYSIRVRNNSYSKACFIVSVDGLSVLNGEEAADNSPGYVLEGHGVLDIACYKVDEATGAKFIFSAKEKSYSEQTGHGTSNVGDIALKVFTERYKPTYRHHYDGGCVQPLGGVKRMMASSAIRSKGWGLDDISYNAGGHESLSIGADIGNLACGIAPVSTNTAATPDMAQEIEDTKLGTEFGESMKWETRTVTFDRNSSPAATLALYYDTRKNLERRGIKFEQKLPPLPNPFPGNGDGCPTPAGWRK
jgi:hypothetical protein